MTDLSVQYLLDTTWLAEYLRGNPKFVQAIQERKTDGLAMSIVTLAELFSGVVRSTDREKAERDVQGLVSQVQVLGIDEPDRPDLGAGRCSAYASRE